MATLVCFALNCYHSATNYTWHHNDIPLVADTYAILYADRIGQFKCVMQALGGFERIQEFSVIGKDRIDIVYRYIIHYTGDDTGVPQDVIMNSSGVSQDVIVNSTGVPQDVIVNSTGVPQDVIVNSTEIYNG